MILAKQLRAHSWLRHVEVYPLLGSTSDRALVVAERSEHELPALIVAERQTAGRGRNGRGWWSGEGALAFSLALAPAEMGLAPRHWPAMSLATALAVCDAITEAAPGRQVKVKWPNDVLLEGRKAAGVLLESRRTADGAADRLVVGIGINVNNSVSRAPEELQATSIALCDATGTTHDRTQLLLGFVNALRARAAQLANEEAELVTAWNERNALAECEVTIQTGDGTLAGRCIDIAPDGSLRIESDGRVVACRSGSVVSYR
ncbi:MAG: biotin--[acetyl-CoA-carboxylase] ligase [Pirellulales bacterium]